MLLKYLLSFTPFCPLIFAPAVHSSRLTTLSSMSASDELDDSQVRQMLFDLESAYNAFNRFLHSS